MMLTDAGALVALIRRNDKSHTACLAVFATQREPLLTTWPCFAEAMYLLFRAGSFYFQAKLWELVSSGTLVFHDLSADEIARMPILMRRYADTPMDLADASLVVLAETFGATRVFTLDSDFFVYRLADGRALEIVP